MHRYISSRKRRFLKIVIGGGVILTSGLMRTLVSLAQQRFQPYEPEITAGYFHTPAGGANAVRIPVQFEEEVRSQVSHAPHVWRCPTSEEGAVYLGSDTSDKFHRLTCRYGQTIAAENRLCFASRETAINQGYFPCGVCKP